LSYGGAGHIMGTCRMGSKKDNSVVNSDQQSWDHDNLYLVGSSTFPTGATANPTLTIAALALRAAEHIAKRV
jgi:choline dehydrogenase-like flavoprotein